MHQILAGEGVGPPMRNVAPNVGRNAAIRIVNTASFLSGSDTTSLDVRRGTFKGGYPMVYTWGFLSGLAVKTAEDAAAEARATGIEPRCIQRPPRPNGRGLWVFLSRDLVEGWKPVGRSRVCSPDRAEVVCSLTGAPISPIGGWIFGDHLKVVAEQISEPSPEVSEIKGVLLNGKAVTRTIPRFTARMAFSVWEHLYGEVPAEPGLLYGPCSLQDLPQFLQGPAHSAASMLVMKGGQESASPKRTPVNSGRAEVTKSQRDPAPVSRPEPKEVCEVEAPGSAPAPKAVQASGAYRPSSLAVFAGLPEGDMAGILRGAGVDVPEGSSRPALIGLAFEAFYR